MRNTSLVGLTILLAEDNGSDLFLFEKAFSAANLTNPLQVVRDGVEVTEYLSGQGKYVDRNKYPFPILLLLDGQMPRMDGLETLAWIRKHGSIKNLWVVMLTSETEVHWIERAYALGANSYLEKPDHQEDWEALVARLHGYWLILPRPPESILKLAESAGLTTPSI
jgi:CheY-like chemotaxis protein